MIALLLALILPVQDPEPAAPEPAVLQEPAPDALMEWESFDSRVDGDEVVYRFVKLAIDMPDTYLRADDVELRIDRTRYEAGVRGDGTAVEPASEPALMQGWTNRLVQSLGLPAAEDGLVRHLFLIGNVDIQSPQMGLRCQRLDYDAIERRTLVRNADLFMPLGQGPRGWPMRILATSLSENPDGSMDAQDLSLTTCSEPEPHYAVHLDGLHGTPLGADDQWRWEPSGGSLSIEGLSVLPVPVPDFETGEANFGITGARIYGNTSLGTAFELQVGSTSKLFGAELDWTIFPTFSERRGFPLSGAFDWKADGFEAEWDLFYLRDWGNDVHPLTQQVMRDGKDRYRARMLNRFELPDSWRLDADLTWSSDPLVDPEFFSDDWYSQRDATTQLYLRHHGESDLFQADVTYRIDDVGFTPISGFGPPGSRAPQTLDAMPRLRYESFSTTLFEMPTPLLGGSNGASPVNFQYGAEAAYLRLRSRDLDTPPWRLPYAAAPEPQRFRVRGWAELTMPLSVGPVFVRPGVRGTANFYEEDAFGNDAAQRGYGEAFIEVGTLLVKTWDSGWQHRVMPQIRLRHGRAGGTPQGSLFVFDNYDVLVSGSVAEFSLRQFYITPETNQPWLDVELLMPFYPDPSKPLIFPDPAQSIIGSAVPVPRITSPSGHWGPAEIRAVWTPGNYGETLEGLRVEGRWRHDFHNGQLDEIFARLTANPHERLRYGIGFQKVQGLFSVADFFAEYRMSDEWGVTFIQPYTFTGFGTRASRLSTRHYAHDFVFEVGFSRDSSTNQSGVFFNIFPRFLVDTPPAPVGH